MRAVLREIPATLKLAVPISLGMLSHMLVQLTDTMLLGHYGTNELAAAAFSGSVVLLILYVGLGFGQGISVLASQALGAGEPTRARGVYHLGAMSGFLYAAAGVLLTLCVLPAFDHMGQPEVVAALGKPFALLIALSFIPTILFQNLRTYYEALKRPWVPFMYMLSLLVVNVFFNWVLIFGKFGFPELGIIGSGLGTLLARTVVAVAFFVHAHRPNEALAAKVKRGTLPWKLFPKLLTIAGAHGLQMIVTMLAYVVGGLWVGHLGAQAIAANRIIGTWDATLFMIPLGLGSALSVRIGRAKGAGHVGQAQVIYRGGFWLTCLFCGVVALGMVSFPTQIIDWFTGDALTASVAHQLILVAALFFLFDNLASITLSSLRGLGDVVVPALTYLGIYWVIAMPLIWWMLFRWHWGAVSVWWGYCLAIVLGACFLMWRFGRVTRLGAPRIV